MIEWIKKSESRTILGNDIDIVISQTTSKKRTSTVIYIKKSLSKLITTTNFIMFGVDKNKLYLAEGNKKDGYALCESSQQRFFVKLADSVLPVKEIEKGEYTLQKDTQGFFIDCLNKK